MKGKRGNHEATGKKSQRGPELRGRIRALLLDAMDLVDEGQKTMIEIVADAARENPLKFLELSSKYVPKEIEAKVDHTISESREGLLAEAQALGVPNAVEILNGSEPDSHTVN